MKTFRKLFVGLLTVAVVGTLVLSYAPQASYAKNGDEICRCLQITGSTSPSDGDWANIVEFTPSVASTGSGTTVLAGGSLTSVGIPENFRSGGTACSVTGTVGKCNPLTDTFIKLDWKVPKLGDFLGNLIRLFFFIAGIIALLFLLIGALKWITSAGKEDGVKEAREQIQAAVLGLIVMVAVLTLVVIVEQVIFGGKLCLGISCPLQLGSINLIK
jgi:hypothetical protein